MAKAGSKEITHLDVDAYVKSTSDFAFEMSVRQQLNIAGCNCSHAATYRDPITDKIRAYDFRASVEFSPGKHARLAVECKNIRPDNPLLVYATERTSVEAFHQVLNLEKVGAYPLSTMQNFAGVHSIYPDSEQVGRATDQITRNHDGSFKPSNDSGTYEKLLQALHSTEDLVKKAALEPFSTSRLIAVLPVLVIPDGMLWQAEFKDDGTPVGAPQKIDRTCLFYNHKWTVPAPMNCTVDYTLSHLEIITLGAVATRIKHWSGSNGLFPN